MLSFLCELLVGFSQYLWKTVFKISLIFQREDLNQKHFMISQTTFWDILSG